jgi:hypothetical protein
MTNVGSSCPQGKNVSVSTLAGGAELRGRESGGCANLGEGLITQPTNNHERVMRGIVSFSNIHHTACYY